MSDEYLIALQRGLGAPILAKRIKYYRDPAFALCLSMRVKSVLRWAFLVVGGAWALATLCGY